MDIELNKNVFSPYYARPPDVKKLGKKEEDLSSVQPAFKDYKHKDAIQFAAASINWRYKLDTWFPMLPRNSLPLQLYPHETGVRAYYRVVSEKPDSYILTACHVNIHGYHRGDLRFIEINDRTVTRGSETTSVIGKLYLGDVVAVTGLASLRNFEEIDVFKSNHDSNCIWMASKITVIRRNILRNVTFSVLKNGVAVVKGQNEVMNVLCENFILVPGRLYIGDAFLPQKMQFNFTEDHPQEYKNHLIAKSSKIHQYPNSLGTIFNFDESPELTELFSIGVDAFNGFAGFQRARRDEIVETCVLMGYSAAYSISNGRFDARFFPLQQTERKGAIVKFFIENPALKPTEGLWTLNSRIRIAGPSEVKVDAIMETVICEGARLKITARLSRETPNWIKFDNGVYIVSQREPLEAQVLDSGFFSETPQGSNGRRIIETLYGGPSIPINQPLYRRWYDFPSQIPIELNDFQCDYVTMMLNGNPMVVGSSPFGCGKSMTIVTAALEIHKNNRYKENFQKQLLVTQSNYASVNLVEIAKKIKENFLDIKFVRYISEKNFKELPEDCLTSMDLPRLMDREFILWAFGRQDSKFLEFRHKKNMIFHLTNKKLLQPNDYSGEAFRIFNQISPIENKKAWYWDLIEAFLILYNPDIIMTTADSLQALLSSEVLTEDSIATIQIDEASQVPEYTLISLLTSFPNATFGLIGDIQQLPPYCETDLEGRLKDYGIGNTMERAVEGNLFPQAILRAVYRCHPKTTELLSELFYNGQLISEVEENQRNIFMLRRPDFWPNSNFPVLVVNNKGRGQKMGTSRSNFTEKEIVKQIIECLIEKENVYKLKPSDIGVISFYSAQTSVLTDALRGKGVKCGTVDAFQGSERDVIILCCTNDRISQFVQLGNRINVAMSRAKQVTIIVGNLLGLKKANYWKTIVKRAEENRCVIQPNQIGNLGTTGSASKNIRGRNGGNKNSNNQHIRTNSRNIATPYQEQNQPDLTHAIGAMRVTVSVNLTQPSRYASSDNGTATQGQNQAELEEDETSTTELSVPKPPTNTELVEMLRMQKELEAMKKEKEKLEAEVEKMKEKEWNMCEICLQVYHQDIENRTPRILGCGHTFCQECAFRMTNHLHQIVCPTCRKLTYERADQLKTNFAIYKHV